MTGDLLLHIWRVKTTNNWLSMLYLKEDIVPVNQFSGLDQIIYESWNFKIPVLRLPVTRVTFTSSLCCSFSLLVLGAISYGLPWRPTHLRCIMGRFCIRSEGLSSQMVSRVVEVNRCTLIILLFLHMKVTFKRSDICVCNTAIMCNATDFNTANYCFVRRQLRGL